MQCQGSGFSIFHQHSLGLVFVAYNFLFSETDDSFLFVCFSLSLVQVCVCCLSVPVSIVLPGTLTPEMCKIHFIGLSRVRGIPNKPLSGVCNQLENVQGEACPLADSSRGDLVARAPLPPKIASKSCNV